VRTLLFLHEVGDVDGATRWRALGAGWLVPDLPGHGVVPPEEGAYYAPGDVALVGVRALAAAGLDGEPPLVAGHGWGAFGAELLAAAGRASALVLVDEVVRSPSGKPDYRWARDQALKAASTA